MWAYLNSVMPSKNATGTEKLECHFFNKFTFNLICDIHVS